jgi:hypothetical protein
MKTIIKPLENMGGLIKIWAIPSLTYSSALLMGKTVTFDDPDSVCEIYCSPDSQNHIEPPDNSTHAGAVFNTKITGFVPGNTQKAREEFTHMNRRPFLVIFTDGNGDYFLAGNYLTPLRFSASFSTGKNTSDRAGHEISFSGKTFEMAKPIDNPF